MIGVPGISTGGGGISGGMAQSGAQASGGTRGSSSVDLSYNPSGKVPGWVTPVGIGLAILAAGTLVTVAVRGRGR